MMLKMINSRSFECCRIQTRLTNLTEPEQWKKKNWQHSWNVHWQRNVLKKCMILSGFLSLSTLFLPQSNIHLSVNRNLHLHYFTIHIVTQSIVKSQLIVICLHTIFSPSCQLNDFASSFFFYQWSLFSLWPERTERTCGLNEPARQPNETACELSKPEWQPSWPV